MRLFVTVGMGDWPFDRLIRALSPLCHEHSVFVQSGTSQVVPACPSAAFLSPAEVVQQIENADVVITHAGNTVRLVQRAGKVPIVVARTARLGEMANDHQVEYLRHEEGTGRVVAVWDVADLARAVAEHPRVQATLLADRTLAAPTDMASLITLLDQEWDRAIANTGNPFRRHPLRRYAFAWEQLSQATGRHLDVGCNTGRFVGTLAATTSLRCFGADPHPDYVRAVGREFPSVAACRIGTRDPLPYKDACFDSVSALDVLEHCPSEDALLAEISRVLRPGGTLVLSVPARHRFSWMDPDNAKYRWPNLHRIVYSLRFGRARYERRFVDRTDGLFGEMSIDKLEHSQYCADWLVQRLRAHAFDVTRQTGANLFWRWFQIPALFVPQAWRAPLDFAIWLDGELFHSANLFITVRRRAER